MKTSEGLQKIFTLVFKDLLLAFPQSGMSTVRPLYTLFYIKKQG